MRARLLFMSLLASCGTRLVAVEADLEVEPAAVVFAATATGDVGHQTLRLTNASRAPLALRLTAPVPFELDLALQLAGGESRAVELPFAPTGAGPATAALSIAGEEVRLVALSGEGVTPVACASPSPCRRSVRDPGTNTCVESDLEEGAACGADNACIAQGQCRAGVCVGASASCDDHDLCTADACEAVSGCGHFAITCAEPADLCQVARCDSALGCTTAPAADGTSCGPSDCTTARVCLSGACQTLAVPEGYACGESSPCRARGHCAQGSCQQPAANPMVEAWNRQLPDDSAFDGVTDASGNVYWVECLPIRGGVPCALVSATASGVERFRAPVAVTVTTDGLRQLWTGGRVVLGGLSGAVAAYSDTTGALLWTHPAPPATTLTGLVADRQQQVLALGVVENPSAVGSLTTFDLATGVQLRSRTLAGRGLGLLLDPQGNSYLTVAPSDPFSTPVGTPPGGTVSKWLTSFSAVGAQRFSVTMDTPDAPRAVFNGELVLASGEVRSTVDGAGRPSGQLLTPNRQADGLSPLMSAPLRYGWRFEGCCPSCDCDTIGDLALVGQLAGLQTERFSRIAADTAWRPNVSQPTLLADGSALFASGLPGELDVKLRAVDARGDERFACTLGPRTEFSGSLIHRWTGATTVTGGRWVVLNRDTCTNCVHEPAPVLRAYEAPGLSTAASGWTGAGGSPGRSGAPR